MAKQNQRPAARGQIVVGQAVGLDKAAFDLRRHVDLPPGAVLTVY